MRRNGDGNLGKLEALQRQIERLDGQRRRITIALLLPLSARLEESPNPNNKMTARPSKVG